ncbi:hypothetical protein JRC04_20805 [Mycolicibacterium sp. S2-37]|uniref:hypothetical protein n=1 Tax=Mycolicibacterium sp. S2-37 TaxID=2810297 RepID=UPI001A93B0D1|nr:hypothetical protein [Mycolicibacterium sp. S2-37]MBO0679916.1 hypothetical protein [Mycolicibacterium sp. S2-37]
MDRYSRALVVACGVVAASLGFGAASAGAQPPPPPPPPPVLGEVPPAWAPPKPAEKWAGQPVVWSSGWGGRWGVWINGGFITLSSNPVTNGG